MRRRARAVEASGALVAPTLASTGQQQHQADRRQRHTDPRGEGGQDGIAADGEYRQKSSRDVRSRLRRKPASAKGKLNASQASSAAPPTCISQNRPVVR